VKFDGNWFAANENTPNLGELAGGYFLAERGAAPVSELGDQEAGLLVAPLPPDRLDLEAFVGVAAGVPAGVHGCSEELTTCLPIPSEDPLELCPLPLDPLWRPLPLEPYPLEPYPLDGGL